MKKFTLIVVLIVTAMLLFAGFAMAAPTDSLEGYDAVGDGFVSQDTSPYYSYDAATDTYGTSIGLWDTEGIYATSYYVLNPRLRDQDAFVYEVVYEGVYTKFPIVNANRTGEKVGKWTNYKRSATNVHTEFTTNTNACASCHMTHTAQGASLLFRANNYATCAACHDGSGIAFLNVFKPSAEIVDAATGSATMYTIGGTHKYAGTFGVDPKMNGSVHLATGDVTIAAAPGGNRVGELKDGTASAAWNADFSCTSCHSPHGSYSFRLLNWNTNNISGRTPAEGGFYFKGLELVADAVYTERLYGWYNGRTENDDPLVYGFTEVVADSGNFKATAPWLFTSDKGALNSLVLYDASNNTLTGKNLTAQYDVNWGQGYMVKKAGATFDAVKADVKLVLVVEGRNTVADSKGDFRYINGVNYNFYCAACHTDYERKLTAGAGMGGSAGDLTGIFSDAHRHTTHRTGTARMEILDTGGNMMCVSCHFVHGTDALIMKTADEKVIGWVANDTGDATFVEANKDINISSAIKRHTNMAVCWQCHSGSKNDIFVNTKYYWNDTANGSDTFTDTSGWNKGR